MKIDKYYLNLAGEYRVCSELLKRGVFATVTYGNMKGCDVVAVGSNRRAAVIEVKTSQSKRFVTGFYQKYKTLDEPHPEFWVLYSLCATGDDFQEQFFILSHQELARIQARRNGVRTTLAYAERARRVAQGVDNVRLTDVADHLSSWHKIIGWCSDPA